jgi:hypothetical protein
LDNNPKAVDFFNRYQGAVFAIADDYIYWFDEVDVLLDVGDNCLPQ